MLVVRRRSGMPHTGWLLCVLSLLRCERAFAFSVTANEKTITLKYADPAFERIFGPCACRTWNHIKEHDFSGSLSIIHLHSCCGF
jgi:hypothetical protein